MNNKNDPTTSILGIKAPKASKVFVDNMFNSPNYESSLVAPMGVPSPSGSRIPIRDEDPSMEGYSPPMGYGTQTPMCDAFLDKWLGCSTWCFEFSSQQSSVAIDRQDTHLYLSKSNTQ